MDHRGRRRATVEVVSVASVPFLDVDDDWLEPADVGATTSRAGGSDRRGFYATIRDEMALLFGEPGWQFTDEEPMMLLWYRCRRGRARRAGATTARRLPRSWCPSP